MSWQSYVDEQLVGTGTVSKAAILGPDGGTWGTSRGFNVSQSEGVAIIAIYQNPAEVYSKGVTVAGTKYVGVKGDDRSLYAKKGATGVAVVKTETAFIIGLYSETQQPGPAYSTVERLADYLIDNNQ